ncbi:hypothetical protein ABE244_06065 [Bacillus toyonensis]|uniref:hypothetical protein n=1 Tax=Bacillus toyonensis TaxID=155322 RepID=UPI003D1B7581
MNVKYKYRLSIEIEGKSHAMEIAADSKDQAISMYYTHFKLNKTNMLFADFKRWVICEQLGFDNIEQFFGSEAEFEKMCRYRRIEFAYMGMRVQIAGRMATIIGNNKSDLAVIYDNIPQVFAADPCWEVVYFDKNGKVIKKRRKLEGVFA